MTLSPIDWIVTIFAIIGIVKIFVILINREKWLFTTRKFYNNPGLFSIVLLILAAVVFYYLIQELTIVQIVAGSAFVALLISLGFMNYSREVWPLQKR